jgi:hypothetical protein
LVPEKVADFHLKHKKSNVMLPLATDHTCLVCAHVLLIVRIMALSEKLKILQTNKHTIQ